MHYYGWEYRFFPFYVRFKSLERRYNIGLVVDGNAFI